MSKDALEVAMPSNNLLLSYQPFLLKNSEESNTIFMLIRNIKIRNNKSIH